MNSRKESASVVNYYDLCRFCLSDNRLKLDLFDEESRRRDLSLKIEALLSIFVREDDWLPKHICYDCVIKIEDFDEYKIGCIRAENLLKAFVPSVVRKQRMHQNYTQKLGSPKSPFFAVPKHLLNLRYCSGSTKTNDVSIPLLIKTEDEAVQTEDAGSQDVCENVPDAEVSIVEEICAGTSVGKNSNCTDRTNNMNVSRMKQINQPRVWIHNNASSFSQSKEQANSDKGEVVDRNELETVVVDNPEQCTSAEVTSVPIIEIPLQEATSEDESLSSNGQTTSSFSCVEEATRSGCTLKKLAYLKNYLKNFDRIGTNDKRTETANIIGEDEQDEANSSGVNCIKNMNKNPCETLSRSNSFENLSTNTETNSNNEYALRGRKKRIENYDNQKIGKHSSAETNSATIIFSDDEDDFRGFNSAPIIFSDDEDDFRGFNSAPIIFSDDEDDFHGFNTETDLLYKKSSNVFSVDPDLLNISSESSEDDCTSAEIACKVVVSAYLNDFESESESEDLSAASSISGEPITLEKLMEDVEAMCSDVHDDTQNNLPEKGLSPKELLQLAHSLSNFSPVVKLKKLDVPTTINIKDLSFGTYTEPESSERNFQTEEVPESDENNGFATGSTQIDVPDNGGENLYTDDINKVVSKSRRTKLITKQVLNGVKKPCKGVSKKIKFRNVSVGAVSGRTSNSVVLRNKKSLQRNFETDVPESGANHGVASGRTQIDILPDNGVKNLYQDDTNMVVSKTRRTKLITKELLNADKKPCKGTSKHFKFKSVCVPVSRRSYNSVVLRNKKAFFKFSRKKNALRKYQNILRSRKKSLKEEKVTNKVGEFSKESKSVPKVPLDRKKNEEPRKCFKSLQVKCVKKVQRRETKHREKNCNLVKGNSSCSLRASSTVANLRWKSRLVTRIDKQGIKPVTVSSAQNSNASAIECDSKLNSDSKTSAQSELSSVVRKKRKHNVSASGDTGICKSLRSNSVKNSIQLEDASGGKGAKNAILSCLSNAPSSDVSGKKAEKVETKVVSETDNVSKDVSRNDKDSKNVTTEVYNAIKREENSTSVEFMNCKVNARIKTASDANKCVSDVAEMKNNIPLAESKTFSAKNKKFISDMLVKRPGKQYLRTRSSKSLPCSSTAIHLGDSVELRKEHCTSVPFKTQTAPDRNKMGGSTLPKSIKTKVNISPDAQSRLKAVPSKRKITSRNQIYKDAKCKSNNENCTKNPSLKKSKIKDPITNCENLTELSLPGQLKLSCSKGKKTTKKSIEHKIVEDVCNDQIRSEKNAVTLRNKAHVKKKNDNLKLQTLGPGGIGEKEYCITGNSHEAKDELMDFKSSNTELGTLISGSKISCIKTKSVKLPKADTLNQNNYSAMSQTLPIERNISLTGKNSTSHLPLQYQGISVIRAADVQSDLNKSGSSTLLSRKKVTKIECERQDIDTEVKADTLQELYISGAQEKSNLHKGNRVPITTKGIHTTEAYAHLIDGEVNRNANMFPNNTEDIDVPNSIAMEVEVAEGIKTRRHRKVKFAEPTTLEENSTNYEISENNAKCIVASKDLQSTNSGKLSTLTSSCNSDDVQGPSYTLQIGNAKVPLEKFLSYAVRSHAEAAVRNCARIRKGQYVCRICGRSFRKKSRFEVHAKMHRCLRTHSCKLGRQEATEVSNLHGDKPFSCVICNMFSKYRQCKNPYKCDTCGKRFALGSALETHTQIHSADSKLTCHVCKRGFTKSTSLACHLRSHFSQKQHKCGHCGRTFACLRTLAKHRLHCQEVPFSCSVCGKKFLRKGTFLSHLQNHGFVKKVPE